MTAYATIAEAQDYFDERLNTDAWDDATTTQKTKALAQSTRLINRLNFVNSKVEDTQENEFPRGSESSVPSDIIYACCEIALALLDGVDLELEYESLTLLQQNYGNMKVTSRFDSVPVHQVNGIPSVEAWRYLYPYLRTERNIRIERCS